MLDKRAPTIRAMFAGVAPRYDLLNHVLSLNLDRAWRRRAVSALGPLPAGPILDLACGTGDLAFAVETLGHPVVGGDFCFEMLAIARSKRRERATRTGFFAADALCLPIADRVFAGLTIAFGARNFEDLPRGLAEMARVLKPGGRLAILEFPPPPPGVFGSLYRFYLRSVLPRIGAWLSPRGSAYSYLPESMRSFLPPAALAEALTAVGFDDVRWELLAGGGVALHTATRSSGSAALPRVRLESAP